MDSIVTRIVTEMVHKVFAHIEKNGLSHMAVIGKALQQYSNECILELLNALIEETERLLLKNKALRRSDRLTVQQRVVPRELVTVFGELRYRRTYYRYVSESGSPCYVYLTDEIIGVESYERITKDLAAEILSDVDMLSYGKAGAINVRPSVMERSAMSYYATFDALITLSRNVDMEAIAREAERAFCVRETVIDMVTDTTFDLWFGEYTEYTDDAAWAFLAKIAPHTVSGEIVYQGEDNTWWRHRFDKKKGEWLEEEGYIAYEDGGKSIRELLDLRKEPEKNDLVEPER